MASAIDEYIDRLKRLTGTSTDSELAERIGNAKQTISSWRRRGKIPMRTEEALAEIFGPEAAFSDYAKYVYNTRERRVILQVFLVLFTQSKWGRDRPLSDWANIFATIESELVEHLRQNGFVRIDDRHGSISVEEEEAVVAFLLALLKAGKVDAYNDALAVFLADDAPGS